MRRFGTGYSFFPHSHHTRENEEAVRRLKIRDQPIQEDETEAQQAMNNMANQLRLVSLLISSASNLLTGISKDKHPVSTV